jgi:homoserine O-acetyltransferase
MTKAYFIVLTKHLKLKKVYAIVGGSMGGMTAFEFAIKFPHFADKIVAYVSSPELSSYDLLWINSQINLIEHLNQLKSPLKNIKAYSDMLTALIARTPEYLNENVKTSEFKDYFNKFYKEPDTIYTLDNYLAQLKAISTYNLSKDLNEELDIITNRIKAKLLIIVSETDMMVNPASSIKLAKNMNAELFILKNNCGHLAVSCEIEKVREIINNFLSKNNSVK